MNREYAHEWWMSMMWKELVMIWFKVRYGYHHSVVWRDPGKFAKLLSNSR